MNGRSGSVSKAGFLLALFVLTLTALFLPGCSGQGRMTEEAVAAIDFKDGDIIFQESRSPQSLAIQTATNSRYSHCGIIFKKDGRVYVYEAISQVSRTPVLDWIRRGVDGHYALMRLRERDRLLGPDALQAMEKAGRQFAGKRYDLLFQWSDDAIYCSELVWKIYQRGAGISLVPLHTFSDYRLDSEVVQTIIKKRYGKTLPPGEKVVAPSDILASPLLKQVSGN